jgi:signal transduction histidine kinase
MRGISGSDMVALPIVTVQIIHERDVVLARRRARRLAEIVGFDRQDQTRIATAVSEIARNAFEYGHGGSVSFALATGSSPQELHIRISDEGPGIENVQSVLDGSFVSPHGMGVGIVGARRIMDAFRIETAPGTGTLVELAKRLPVGAPMLDATAIRQVAHGLAGDELDDSFNELNSRNKELVHVLAELRERQLDLERLNSELEETNRGVVALYAELDDRAEDLRRASDYKTRFLSDVSHELRTPLTSVLNLTRLLLDRTDGELTSEQEIQVSLIRKSVEGLAKMVNELLDVAKIEAGRITLRPSAFTVSELFAGLRGMFRPLLIRPLLISETVALHFEEEGDLPVLHTDEDRLSQILRNLVSNAVKFTPQGEVRVTASPEGHSHVRFEVADTGIGIEREDQERIFEEFVQIDGPIQRRLKGTGLGLAFTRKLAGLLGGSVLLVDSAKGVGSRFAAIIPCAAPTDSESITHPSKDLHEAVEISNG